MWLTDPIFSGPSAGGDRLQKGEKVAAIKTYRYLRLGMLAAVAALSYSLLEEHYARGVHCWLGSISGYYYTPVHPVFIGVMVSIGLALIVIKGSTVVEDACLSLAGVMAPVVAFIPTTSESDSCSRDMANVGHYVHRIDLRLAANSISNDLHAYLFAGGVIIGLLFVVGIVEWRGEKRNGTTKVDQYTVGTWWSLVGAIAVLIVGWVLLVSDYSWVIQGHGKAAVVMFAFLALAAIANGIFGLWNKYGYTKRRYAVPYLIIGVGMLGFGVAFVIFQVFDRSAFNGHLVLIIEVVELVFFMTFWALQTVERWNYTVLSSDEGPSPLVT